MRIATWNVNSIRARLPNVLKWLSESKPDVLLMQEIKCETECFPAMDFQMAGYKVHALGQKSYNGVAIASLHEIENVLEGLPGCEDSHARYLEATIKDVRVVDIYLPNGNPINTDKFAGKLAWMELLKTRAVELLKAEMPVAIGGDFNVIQTPLDVYDPAGWEKDALYHPAVRESYRRVISMGYTEIFRALHPDERAYSFWDYQSGAWAQDRGLRIDHFLLSPEAVDRTIGCTIDKAPRGEDKASDHTPVILEIAD